VEFEINNGIVGEMVPDVEIEIAYNPVSVDAKTTKRVSLIASASNP
jgi:hypothetical protein